MGHFSLKSSKKEATSKKEVLKTVAEVVAVVSVTVGLCVLEVFAWKKLHGSINAELEDLDREILGDE